MQLTVRRRLVNHWPHLYVIEEHPRSLALQVKVHMLAETLSGVESTVCCSITPHRTFTSHSGKPCLKLPGKTWKNMENHGKTWKNMEKHGTTFNQFEPYWYNQSPVTMGQPDIPFFQSPEKARLRPKSLSFPTPVGAPSRLGMLDGCWPSDGLPFISGTFISETIGNPSGNHRKI